MYSIFLSTLNARIIHQVNQLGENSSKSKSSPKGCFYFYKETIFGGAAKPRHQKSGFFKSQGRSLYQWLIFD
jgi:hypothetical protein